MKFKLRFLDDAYVIRKLKILYGLVLFLKFFKDNNTTSNIVLMIYIRVLIFSISVNIPGDFFMTPTGNRRRRVHSFVNLIWEKVCYFNLL